MRTQKGFTLAELLIVIAIILVLVTIALPAFAGAGKSAEDAVCKANRTNLVRVLTMESQLGKPLDKAQSQALAKDQELVCPKGGTFVITPPTATSIAKVSCSLHSPEDTVSEDEFASFEEFWKNWQATHDATQQSNDIIRQAYFMQFSLAGKSFPLLQVGNADFIIQPFYQSKAPSDGNIWLFAKIDTGNGWNANYVYDPVGKKWYGATSWNGKLWDGSSANKPASSITFDSADDLRYQIEHAAHANGKPKWLPLEDYTEIPPS
ncbi:MAG: prepilin-type N-terminal cleavage/methylation domain-containing protein [Raoultibacter sp.]